MDLMKLDFTTLVYDKCFSYWNMYEKVMMRWRKLSPKPGRSLKPIAGLRFRLGTIVSLEIQPLVRTFRHSAVIVLGRAPLRSWRYVFENDFTQSWSRKTEWNPRFWSPIRKNAFETRFKRQIYAVSITKYSKEAHHTVEIRQCSSRFRLNATLVALSQRMTPPLHTDGNFWYLQYTACQDHSDAYTLTKKAPILERQAVQSLKLRWNWWNPAHRIRPQYPHRIDNPTSKPITASPIIEAPIPIPSICLFQVVKAHSSEKVDSITFFSLSDEIRFGKDETSQRVSRMQPIIQLTYLEFIIKTLNMARSK